MCEEVECFPVESDQEAVLLLVGERELFTNYNQRNKGHKGQMHQLFLFLLASFTQAKENTNIAPLSERVALDPDI